MPLPQIEAILAKYTEEEDKIDALFKKLEKCVEVSCRGQLSPSAKLPTLEEAKARNKQLLKDLETVKGNLRSKSIFSPTEMQWESICKRYQDEPSLQVTTWRCNLPIFV